MNIKNKDLSITISLGSVTFEESKIEDFSQIKDKLTSIFSNMNLLGLGEGEEIELCFGGKKQTLKRGVHFHLHC